MKPFYPPFKFSTVEKYFYRGALPISLNTPFLKLLRLKTIISCIPSEPDQFLQEFCTENDINLLFIQVESFDGSSDPVSIPPSQMSDILTHIISIHHHPLFLHCLDGTNVTGTIIMCLRRLQNWAFSSILQEFQRFASSPIFPPQVSSYVEHFSTSIDIPPIIPRWLWPTIQKIHSQKGTNKLKSPKWFVLTHDQKLSIKHPLLDLEFLNFRTADSPIDGLSSSLDLVPSINMNMNQFPPPLDSWPVSSVQGGKFIIKRKIPKKNPSVTDSMNLYQNSAHKSLPRDLPTSNSSASSSRNSSSTPIPSSKVAESLRPPHMNEPTFGWSLIDMIDALLDSSKIEWYIRHAHQVPFLEYVTSTYSPVIIDQSSLFELAENFSFDSCRFSTVDILTNEFDTLRRDDEDSEELYTSQILESLSLSGISIPLNIEALGGDSAGRGSVFSILMDDDGSSSSSDSDGW